MTSLSDARILIMSEEDYHNDQVGEGPTLSYSTASKIIRESPLHAWHSHPRLGGHRVDPTSSMEDGTIIHALLLEDDPGRVIQLVPFGDFRTKEAREARDQIRAAGKIPLTLDKFDRLTTVASALRERLCGLGIEFSGERELAIAWTAASATGPVNCRGKLDHVNRNTGIIDDIKTCANAHPDRLQRAIADSGYDIQYAAYTSAVERLWPELAGRTRFRFIFCELEPPYAVTPVELDGLYREYGIRRWNRAVDTWARCLTTNVWPSYTESVAKVTPAPWLLAREEGEYDGSIL